MAFGLGVHLDYGEVSEQAAGAGSRFALSVVLPRRVLRTPHSTAPHSGHAFFYFLAMHYTFYYAEVDEQRLATLLANLIVESANSQRRKSGNHPVTSAKAKRRGRVCLGIRMRV